MPKNKKRLDEYLVEGGYFNNTEDVKRAVIAHEVRVGTTYVDSAAVLLELDDNDICKEELFIKGIKQFVSRGGLKLSAALEEFDIDVKDKHCLDIGSSTGGFTDCLLQAGAADVVCVDVNYGQLAWSLRENPKVKVFERLNIKDAVPSELGAPFDIVVTDVSFISLASIAEVVASMCAEGSTFVGLIKPQFECKKGETEGGVVVDDSIRQRTIDEVIEAYKAQGFGEPKIKQSPVKGPAGNIEYLIYTIKQS